MGGLARRVVLSSDAERKRLERALHDDAQQRLVAASTTLGLALRRLETGEEGAAELVAEASEELRRCAEDLRELAREIYPAVLAERGLGSALNDLARRSSAVVSLDVVDARFPEPVELAVYLVVSAVLREVDSGNEVTIRVAAAGGELVVEMHGAGAPVDPLRDRVEALDGRIDASGDSLRVTVPVD
jgi:signal transduction histidine kinase